MSRKVLVMEGDGIGAEIVGQARRVLDAVDRQDRLDIAFSEAMLGGRAYEQYGHPYPEETREKALAADAILFGAVGGPQWDGGKVERHLRPEQGLLDIRSHLDLFANFRPAITFPQLADASSLKKELVAGLDILIVRELTGGIYFGEPRGIRTLESGEREGFNTDIYSESEIRRIAHVAFQAAQKRDKKLCSVDKANVLEVTVLWRELMEEVGKEYPEAMTIKLNRDIPMADIESMLSQANDWVEVVPNHRDLSLEKLTPAFVTGTMNVPILVGIGTDSDYELAGVTREFFHSDLQFEVQAEGVDAELRVPSEAQMSSRTEGQAIRDYSSLAQEASASPIQSSANSINRSAGGNNGAQAGRLALTTTSDANPAGSSNSSTESSLAAQQAANEALSSAISENAVLKEQLDASEIERQELEERLANLEEQIDLLEEERALQIENAELATVQQAVSADNEVEEPAEAPIVAPEPPPETLLDKLNAFRYWIFGGLAIILVIALLVVLLVLRQRKSSEVDELYYDDEVESDAEDFDDDEDYLNAEATDDDDEFDEGIDEITKDLSDDEADDEYDEILEDDADEEELEDEDTAEEQDKPLFAASFEEAEEEGEEAFEADEFEDLDEFFSDESSGATEVLFGDDDEETLEESEDSDVSDESDLDAAVEESPSDEDEDLLDFNVDDLEIPEETEEETPELDDENSLEFEIGEMDLGSQTAESESEEIDLEDKFGYAEEGITGDLGSEAEADFEESIEVHSSDMNELLVPEDTEDSDEDGLFIGEAPEAEDDSDADDGYIEEMEEDVESLFDPQAEENDDADTLIPVDEDLNLDEDMDADLGDLDLDDDDLDMSDSDEEFLTKLELAEAYIEMGDVQGAKELLSEVESDGNAEQQAAAKSLLEGIKG
eukprot:g4338.t1